ncbi:MAG: DNA mismatch repair endonuclease MutL [Pseudomonadota bacterium]
MSGLIQLLPESLINQIAAGEVVERPASVVKELLENSVDAGAADIQVDILQSGKTSIRVTDNGRGMTREDLLLAIERHATSKIREYADLMALRSMGFRGEALPSIAAVSRMTIHSIPRGSGSGNRLEIWGGKKNPLQEVGGVAGTMVEVLDLFYNTPARMAFLKSPRVEWNQIQMAVERVALGFPGLRFDLTHNGKKILQLFPAQDLTLRLQDLWGSEKTGDLIPVDLLEDGIRIAGFISPPHCHQNTSRHIAFVVNQRWVRSPLLYPLLLRAFANMIPAGRFPTVVLWMDVPPELIDVNIHPTKQEVRFSQTSWIQTLVGKALGQALKSHIPKPIGQEKGFHHQGWEQGSGQPFLFKESSLPHYLTPSTPGEGLNPFALPMSQKAPSRELTTDWAVDNSPGGGAEPKGDQGFAGLTVLTQLQGTYLVALMKSGLILIDQHAAHERILYERYLKQWQSGGIASQYLIVPILIEGSPGWTIELEAIQSAMGALGFEVTSAGGNSWWIKSIPAGIGPGQAEKAFGEILEEIRAGGGLLNQEALVTASLKLLACHSAIRAGQILSAEEITSLMVQLDQAECPSHCPHGRPLWIEISWEEIEKRFKRR